MDIGALTHLREVQGSVVNAAARGLPRFDSKYERLKVIGKGSFGTAYLVRRKGHRTKLVAKEMMYSLDDLDGRFTKSLADVAANEIRVLSRLAHNNLVKFIECFEDVDRMVVIMEFAGKDLERVVRSQRRNNRGLFEEQQLLHWVVQMLMGLKYLHGSNVLHRDFCLKNIFLASDGLQVKIGDFGLAKINSSSSQPQAHSICGTLQNFAPELVNQEPYSSKADLWSCGVCLYELMTLAHPFATSASQLQLLENIRRAAPPTPNPTGRYSEELEGLCMGLLTADPKRRMSADEALALPLVRRYLTSIQDGSPAVSALSSPTIAAASPALPRLPGAAVGGPARSIGFSGAILSGDDESDVDRVASPVMPPLPSRRRSHIAEDVRRMEEPSLTRPDLDEWITRTYSDAAVRKRIRSLLSLALGAVQQTPPSVEERLQHYDDLIAALGDQLTIPVQMTLMAMIFTQ